MNLFAVSAGLFEYYLFGYWMLAVGVVGLFLPGLPGGIWIALFGLGCYVFIVANALRNRLTRNGEPHSIARRERVAHGSNGSRRPQSGRE